LKLTLLIARKPESEKGRQMIRHTCPKCGESVESPSSLAGCAETCPGCGFVVTVPLPKVKQGLATASVVCGICGLAWPTSVLWFAGVAAMVMGAFALRKTKRAPSGYGGRGRAKAGIACGAVGVVLGVSLGLLQVQLKSSLRDVVPYAFVTRIAPNGTFRVDLPMGCRLNGQPSSHPSQDGVLISVTQYETTTLDDDLTFVIVTTAEAAVKGSAEEAAEQMLRDLFTGMDVAHKQGFERRTYVAGTAVRGIGNARSEGIDLLVVAEGRVVGRKPYTLVALSRATAPRTKVDEAVDRFFRSFEILEK